VLSELNSTTVPSFQHSLKVISTPRPDTYRTVQSPPYPANGPIIASSGHVLPRPTGNQAPYPVNPSSPATITYVSAYPGPTGTGRSSLSFNSTGKSSNQTLNTLCTVNVPSANIEWWYGATFYSAVGTYTQFAPNWTSYQGQYLTMYTNTQTGPFDVSSAIESDSAWSEHVTYDSVYGFTLTDYIPYTVTPAAATTSVVERDYLPTLPPGNLFPASDLYTYLTADSTAATVAIDSTFAITSDTPFMYFTAYEVESKANGTTSTQTINLAQPTAVTYAVVGIENSASASGTVPADFVQHIPQSTCVPGTVQGSVTVLVVVDLLYIYLPHVNPFIVHIESTVLGWDDGTVMLAAATSTGQSFTMGNKAAPTQSGASPGSTPAAGNGASESPRPGKIAPSENQSGGNQSGGTQSGGNQSSGSQSSSGQTGSDSSNSNPATPPRETVGTIGTNPVIVGPSSVVIVGSQTVQPGAPVVTIAGISISVAPAATAIVVNGHPSTLPIVADPDSPTRTIGTIGDSPVIVGPSSVVVGTVGSNPIIVGPSSAVVVGTQILHPGDSVVIVNGSPVSLVPSGNALVVGSTAANGAIVGTQTISLPRVIFPAGSSQAQAGAAPPVLTIGSSTLTANAGTQFLIAPGQTLTPGGTATVGGQLVSLDSTAGFIVVGGSTQKLSISTPSLATSLAKFVIDGNTITALPNTSAASNQDDAALNPTFVISGQTLVPGHAINVAGTVISLPLSGSFAVINGATSTFTDAAVPLTFAGAALTLLPNAGPSFTIEGQLLTPGAVITVSGTTISLAHDSTVLVVNGATTPLAQYATILTIDTHTYTALPSSGPAFLIDGKPLNPDGEITISGTIISLSPNATAIVINGITTFLSPNAAANAKAIITNPPILTIGDHTYTALPSAGTAFAIDGQTLTPGGTVVVNETTIVLSPGATELVYGSAGRSKTEALFPATTTTTTTATRGASRTGVQWPASAGATQRVGQAAPTESTRGLAPRRKIRGVLMMAAAVCAAVFLL
jgi:hypothetical protein